MDQFKYLNMSAKDLSLYDAQQQAVNTANSLPKVSTGRAASDGCAHCCSPLFAGRKCKNCGKVHWDDELHNAKVSGVRWTAGLCRWWKRRTEMTDYKSMFEQAVRTLAAIDEALGIGDDGCGDPDQTLTAIADLKALQKIDAPQLRKIHPLDIPIEVFLADLTTRPANIIRAELAGFASYADTGTFDIEPPFTVRHLCMFSRSEMRKWPNFGRKCLNEVEEMLRARGLQLWENHDERSLRLLREHKEYFK